VICGRNMQTFDSSTQSFSRGLREERLWREQNGTKKGFEIWWVSTYFYVFLLWSLPRVLAKLIRLVSIIFVTILKKIICNKNTHLQRWAKQIERLQAQQSLEPLVEHLNCNELKMGCRGGCTFYIGACIGQGLLGYNMYYMKCLPHVWSQGLFTAVLIILEKISVTKLDTQDPRTYMLVVLLVSSSGYPYYNCICY
jgi:hypothetical protein